MARIINGGNDFWAQVLERWKTILKYSESINDDFLSTLNINLHPKTSYKINITPYNNICVENIIDQNYNILTVQELESRFPRAIWTPASTHNISYHTLKIRSHLKNKNSFTGNFFPSIPIETQLISPLQKGCKRFYTALKNPEFLQKDWQIFKKHSTKFNLTPTELTSIATHHAKTTLMPECRDLQFLTLRNTCITNEKLFKSKLTTSPGCNLCPNPTQNAEHRFYN